MNWVGTGWPNSQSQHHKPIQREAETGTLQSQWPTPRREGHWNLWPALGNEGYQILWPILGGGRSRDSYEGEGD